MTVDEWGYCLMKKRLENSLASVVTGEHSEKAAVYEAGSRPSPDY